MEGYLEDSIDSKIENLKLQQQVEETKLKEKCAHDTMVMTLNRGVQDALKQAAKLEHDHQEAVVRTATLEIQLEKEKVRWKAQSGLLDDIRKELQILHEKSIQGVSKVWNLRSQLSKSVQNISDQCDVWALFSKPKSLQLPAPKKVVNEITEPANECDARLQNAMERHAKLQAERDRLLNEPDAGEEFLRIKNALRYSATMAENFK